MFAKDTLEDPAFRIERDGFLDEIERIADAMGVFDHQPDALDAFLAAPGRQVVPEPEHLERYGDAVAAAGGDPHRLADEVGVEVAYALSTFARGGRCDPRHQRALEELDVRLPRPEHDAPYLEVELAELPEIAEPKVKPKRLSTGHAPLEIARIGSAWRISCTGCGEASALVQFRWQALEESVCGRVRVEPVVGDVAQDRLRGRGRRRGMEPRTQPISEDRPDLGLGPRQSGRLRDRHVAGRAMAIDRRPVEDDRYNERAEARFGK